MAFNFKSALLVATSLAAQGVLADFQLDSEGKYQMKMNENGTFKIVQFTDLHFGENEDRDLQTQNLMRNILQKENADFAAVTGDIVSGFAWNHSDPSFWQKNHQKMVSVFQETETYYGMVPGYHDFETDASSGHMMTLDAQTSYAFSKFNDFRLNNKAMSHNFTYKVDVKAHHTLDETELRIWFFGTGRDDCMGLGGNDCIRRDQIHWYKDESLAIPVDDKFRKNGIAFMHHALQEHMHLANSYPVRGQKRDYSTCQALNTGLYAEMCQLDTVQWISAGGDHSTDFYGQYGKINLSYGRKTGYNSHGPKFQQKGARVFEISVDHYTGEMEIDTWIRNADGSQDDQDEVREPSEFSWLDKGHCLGTEKSQSILTDILPFETENSWLPFQ